jgi:acyl-CoA reductase-like NAD-dependent aldehyde dehydrogenase/nicotinamidase-related amidase
MTIERTALLLVDIQEDFLRRPGLLPEARDLVERLSVLLEGFRRLALPVAHAHTRVAADGADAMPHWRDKGISDCRAGSPGSLPPAPLAPSDGEPLFFKRFFSPFENLGLLAWLKERQVTTLVVAGLYTHACVRAAALDAYARGLRVVIPHDGVATTDVLHGEITREYLSTHGVAFAPIAGILGALGEGRATADDEHATVKRTSRAAAEWCLTPPERRVDLLRRWRAILAERRDQIIAGMIDEIAKPLGDAREEFDRALAHIDAAAELALRDGEAVADGVRVLYRPVGCVALITPWNNPLAIPAGKIAPALAFGNTIVWKPSPHATRTARALLACLDDTGGLPDDVVMLVEGGGETARRLILDDAIDAVSLTGGVASGQIATALCAIGRKPLQAELGGNNAHVVLAGADHAAVAGQLVRAAFGFSGQRCTAVRRVIAVESVYGDFLAAFVDAAERLPVGKPDRPDTIIGPVLDPERVQCLVDRAIAEGARLVAGGRRHAAIFLPTILECDDPGLDIVQHESFAPIVVMLKARDASDALRLANAVPQGLLAGVSGGTSQERQAFLDRIAAGIVRMGGPPRIDASAPFGGWKASGCGCPEHGRWDREFYARPQAVYDEARGGAP